MAKFRYMGEKQFKFVKVMGNCMEIRCRCKDGSTMTIKPGPGESHFAPSVSVCETMDPRSIRHMRVDSRFQEIP